MNILITSVGSTTSISIIKALRKSVNNIKITGTDYNEPYLCAGSHLVDHFIKLPPCNSKDRYIDALQHTLITEKIDCLIPVHDLEIEAISSNKDILAKHTFVATNTKAIIDICNDKSLANEYARSAGLLVPKSLPFRAHKQEKTYPLIAKPLRGVSSRDIVLLNNQDSLYRFIEEHDTDNYILQEFIKGEEYTVDTYSDYFGEFYGAVARKRIETKAGISTKGVTIQNETIYEHSKTLLNSLGYHGAANIQFIECDGLYYFIEINPRFSGGGILSYEAGFNSPYFTLLSSAEKSLPPFTELDITYNLYMTRYWEESFQIKGTS